MLIIAKFRLQNFKLLMHYRKHLFINLGSSRLEGFLIAGSWGKEYCRQRSYGQSWRLQKCPEGIEL